MKALILGCGYIGSEVAALWKKRGYFITATTRSPSKLELLSRVAQKSVLLKNSDEEELAPLIADHDVILVAIAADNLENYESAYRNTSQIFRHLALEMDMPRHLIYTSSSSVYGDHHGQWVDEASELLAKSEQAQFLIDAEKNYLSLSEIGWHTTLLRLSEIYGPDRELSQRVKKFQGHILPGNGHHFTNMIHKIDCAAAIDYALRHRLEGIYNLSDDEHPTRKELYDLIARKFSLPTLKWDPEHTPLHSGNKRISNHKIKSEGFAFHHPHRVLD